MNFYLLFSNPPGRAKAVCCADKIHNMESLIEVYKQSDKKDFWKKFNADKEDKEWFEQEVLSMFKESGWNHPLVGIYEKLIVQFKELAG